MNYLSIPIAQRIEAYSIYSLFFSLIFIFICFILLLLFSKHPILKSRGITPFMACFFHFLSLSIYLLFYIPIGILYPSICFIYSFILSTELSLGYISIFQFLKFIVIMSYDKWKYNMNNRDSKVPLFLKISKYLNTWPVLLFVIFINFVLNLLLLCINQTMNWMLDFISISSYSLFFIIFTVLSCLDLCMNIKKIKKIKNLNDQNYFRLETYVFGICLVLPICFLCVLMIFIIDNLLPVSILNSIRIFTR